MSEFLNNEKNEATLAQARAAKVNSGNTASSTQLSNQGEKWLISGILVLFLSVIFVSSNGLGHLKIALQSPNDSSICPIYEPKVPQTYLNDKSKVHNIVHDEKFRLQSVKKLSGAVQVDTQIGDNQPDVPDAPEQWVQFQAFHDYLEKTFPTVHKHLQVDKVNTYGLVFTWKGSNKNLKPSMYIAHQDVVPVQKETLKDWTYPPFDGHYDGTYLYGRGALDCKNLLIAMLEALELLIADNFKPQRGIIVAFGFDEESIGIRGAANIAKHLEKKYGHDSIYSLIDEGPGLTLDAGTGQYIATPANGEKGDLNIHVFLSAPGGHSSYPPDHTAVGIMAELSYNLENDPYEPFLTSKNPVLRYLQCLAVNTGDKLPKFTRKAILRAGFDKLANNKVLKMLLNNPMTNYLVRTTQSLDVVQGGEKANSLPEHVKLVINHRVAIETPFEEVEKHFSDHVVEVAKKYNISVEAFGEQVHSGDPKNGQFTVVVYHKTPAAPVSPSNDTVWEYLAGTTRHVFEDVVFTNLSYPIMTTPFSLTGTTDSKYYANLTKHIYRYTPGYPADFKENKIHSVDEKVPFDSHLHALAFYYEYIQNVDTPDAGN